MSKKPTCPRCSHRKFAMMKGGALRCLRCGAVHDTNNEGIFATHTDPVRSAIHSENTKKVR